MAFKIRIREDALEDLERIPKSDAKRILERIENHLPQSALLEEQLKGELKGLRRMRVGDYRVIFAIEQETVIVLQVMNRKDIYR